MKQIFKYFLGLIKYIISIIIVFCIGAFLIVISINPYNKGPEQDNFQSSRTTKYTIIGENTGLQLDIKNNITNQTNTIITKTTNQIIYPGDNIETTFSFTNHEQSGNNYFFIQFPNQATIALYPETSIKISTNKEDTSVQKISGNFEYFLPSNNKNIKIQNGTQKDYNNFIGKDLLINYDSDKQKYIVNQLGGSIMLNPKINKLRKNILDILYKVWPQRYQDNLNNYKEFEKILQRKESEQTIYTNNQKEVQNNIFEQIKKGFSQTKFAN